MIFELEKNSFSRYLGRNLKLLVKFEHPEFETPFRLINDTKQLTIDGETFEPFPFDLVLPSQTEKQGTQIVLSNISHLVANAINETILSNENAICTVYIVNIESDTAEKYARGVFEIMTAVIEQESVTLGVNIRHSLDYNIGSMRYNRQLFGNLYL